MLMDINKKLHFSEDKKKFKYLLIFENNYSNLLTSKHYSIEDKNVCLLPNLGILNLNRYINKYNCYRR